jgi:hypothetical protein
VLLLAITGANVGTGANAGTGASASSGAGASATGYQMIAHDVSTRDMRKGRGEMVRTFSCRAIHQ